MLRSPCFIWFQEQRMFHTARIKNTNNTNVKKGVSNPSKKVLSPVCQ